MNISSIKAKGRAKALYKKFFERVVVKDEEREASKLLLISCIESELDNLKKSTVTEGELIGFDSAIEMAVYFIEELPEEWDKWKMQTELCMQFDHLDDRFFFSPVVDRIDFSKGFVAGNLQMLTRNEYYTKTGEIVDRLKLGRELK
ncbi:hypothetical protein ACFTQ7_04115 [Lysinibacillus sp. NPDC056959]|uniref:hypothetical protein n=1 Tax=Lysinibacillus sp. NPDC056959 TaxID=3345981 RepID=UPI003624D899